MHFSNQKRNFVLHWAKASFCTHNLMWSQRTSMGFKRFKGREPKYIGGFSYSTASPGLVLCSLSNKHATLKAWEMFFPYWHSSGLQEMAFSPLQSLEIFCTFCPHCVAGKSERWYSPIWQPVPHMPLLLQCHSECQEPAVLLLPWDLTWAGRNSLYMIAYSIFTLAQKCPRFWD